MSRKMNRRLTQGEVIKVSKFIETNRDVIQELCPKVHDLEKWILDRIGINGNGQSFRSIAADVGVTWKTMVTKTPDLTDINDLKWSVSVLAEAIATLYSQTDGIVPDGVQAVRDSVKMVQQPLDLSSHPNGQDCGL